MRVQDKVTVATIHAGGQTLMLLPEKAVFLPETGTLLVADAHIGKAASFRRLGVPVPHGTTAETLDALGALILRLAARRVIVLGDFLHSAGAHAAGTQATLARWREAHAATELTLVRGNHDDLAGDPAPALHIETLDEPLHLGGLALCHHPRPHPGRYVLAGHLHPCISVSGRANDHMRLPCFHFGPEVGVLPAFGAFTGMHALRVAPGDRVYAVAEDGVVRIAR